MPFLTGYAVFHWIAGWANPFCDVFFTAITDLGYHTFYYLAVAPLFWIVDRRRALVLLSLIVISGYLNTVAKLVVHTPRPDPALVRVLDLRPYQSGSNAFPSGHAQNAVVFWGYLAYWLRRRWAMVTAGIMVALISFSRLYLGVHFPIDIAGGLMLGVGLTWLALAPSERWEAAGCPIPLSAAVGLCLAAWLAAVLSTDLAFAMLGGTLAAIVLTLRVRLSRLRFERPWQAPAVVAVGIVLLLAMSALLGTLPRSAEWVFASVTALWAVALVGYPLLLQRLLAAEEAVSVELG